MKSYGFCVFPIGVFPIACEGDDVDATLVNINAMSAEDAETLMHSQYTAQYFIQW